MVFSIELISHECCGISVQKAKGSTLCYRYRHTIDELEALAQKLKNRLELAETWLSRAQNMVKRTSSRASKFKYLK